MTKKMFTLVAIILVASMALSACAPAATPAPVVEPTAVPVQPTAAPVQPTVVPPTVEPPTPIPPTEIPQPTPEPSVFLPVAAPLICQVTDTGGIDDKSFNTTAWKGVTDAIAKWPTVVGKYLESQQQADYEVNINAFLAEKCDLIIPVGFLLADATTAAVKANPNQKFAIIDVDYLSFPTVRGSGFAIDQATFLNGYLAAAMTKTGIVGTYVGIAFPATTKFMDGFALGVEYYNQQKGTSVKVLGWDVKTRKGLEVGNFESTDDGRKMAETLMDEGADIIMPVAGPVGLGSLAVMEERGSGMLIGVDNDWSLANPDKAKFILSSAMKNMDLFVTETIGMVIDGKFQAGNWLGNLDNGGVALVYGSELGATIPAELKAEIEALIPLIKSGEIKTLPEGVY